MHVFTAKYFLFTSTNEILSFDFLFPPQLAGQHNLFPQSCTRVKLVFHVLIVGIVFLLLLLLMHSLCRYINFNPPLLRTKYSFFYFFFYYWLTILYNVPNYPLCYCYENYVSAIFFSLHFSVSNILLSPFIGMRNIYVLLF